MAYLLPISFKSCRRPLASSESNLSVLLKNYIFQKKNEEGTKIWEKWLSIVPHRDGFKLERIVSKSDALLIQLLSRQLCQSLSSRDSRPRTRTQSDEKNDFYNICPLNYKLKVRLKVILNCQLRFLSKF